MLSTRYNVSSIADCCMYPEIISQMYLAIEKIALHIFKLKSLT